MYIGEKVKLREYRKEDVKQAQEFMNDEEIKSFLTPGIPFLYTYEDEMKWFEGNSATKETYNFAIETLTNYKYIGGCGINNIDWKNSVAVVGIFIGDKNYWSKGYGTDAMKILVSFIFNEMNINKIKLHVYSFNPRAIRSYEKCGFIKEGVLRQEVFRKGEYYNDIIMGLLRDDFTK